MLKVRDGNAAAYEELVLRHQDRLHHVLENLVRDHELAKDLAQEVFLRVFKARERYDPRAKFSTWLYTIANNVALNAKRDNSRRKEVQVEAYSSGEQAVMPMERLAVASSGSMPARRMEKSEQAEVVKQAIDSLNERQKMAILLSKFEGMGYADIAEAMDSLPKPSSRSSLAPESISKQHYNLIWSKASCRPHCQARMPTPLLKSQTKPTIAPLR